MDCLLVANCITGLQSIDVHAFGKAANKWKPLFSQLHFLHSIMQQLYGHLRDHRLWQWEIPCTDEVIITYEGCITHTLPLHLRQNTLDNGRGLFQGAVEMSALGDYENP